MRRVVITGMGAVSPLGSDLDTIWRRARNGESGLRSITKFDTTDYTVKIAGEVVEFELDSFVPKKEQRRMDEFSHYAMGAGKMAFADSGLDMAQEDPGRCGCLIGSGIGGLQTLQTQYKTLLERGPQRCSPFMIPQMISNMASGLLAIDIGFTGPNYAVISACATAGHAIGNALWMIQRGDADVVCAGGSEATICELGVAGFANMRALSTRNDDPQAASRPFDKDRDGFVMAEGAAIVMLEELEHAKARGAKIYAEVCGCGMTCDAFHMTAPADDGNGGRRAMEMAMKDAGITAADVDYVNAHGTSTPLNDKVETMAIKGALGDEHARRVMISSTKSMTGHMLGAAAGIETIFCALALRDGVIPPTINYTTPDPECDLDYVPNDAREAQIQVCLNNSLGFGGHNCTLCLRRM